MKKTLLSVATAVFAFGSINAQQVFFEEDFSSASGGAMPMGITAIDADGDGENWYTFDAGAAQGITATSASWHNPGTPTPLNPDNWMISSAIDLSGATGTTILEWKAYAQDQSWADENYSVYVATSDNPTDLENSAVSFSEIVGSSNGWLSRDLDISSLNGQTIYFAFRHHNVTDQFRLNIDDIRVREVAGVDAILSDLDITTRTTTASIDISGEITNNGANPITSIDITWTDGSNSFTHTESGINIPFGGTYQFTHPDQLSVVGGTNYDITVSLDAANDADASNDELSQKVYGLTFESANAVVIEEGTGTWCGWCPRGKVAMEEMYNTFGDDGFTGIMVHNGDPMTLDEYDNASDFSGFPQMHANRTLLRVGVSQANMETTYNLFIDRLDFAEVVVEEASIPANSRDLTVEMKGVFAASSDEEFRFAAILVEDGVTGTSSDYDQSNFYAGGGNGAMGGYENLPNPVPAADMVYDHVGRALMGGYDGETGSIPASVSADAVYTHTFDLTVDAEFDLDKISVVGMIIESSTGRIVNAHHVPVTVAGTVNNSTATGSTGGGMGSWQGHNTSVEERINPSSVRVFPNPSSNMVNIDLTTYSSEEVRITVFNLLGSQVESMEFNANGFVRETLNVANYESGIYFVQIQAGDQKVIKKIVVE